MPKTFVKDNYVACPKHDWEYKVHIMDCRTKCRHHVKMVSGMNGVVECALDERQWKRFKLE